MTERLLVKEAFGDYSLGDRITDARTMKRVTATHPEYVLRENAPEEASPDPSEAPAVPLPAPAEDAKVEAPARPRTTRHVVTD